MRVSQRSIYASSIRGMQSTMSDYMDLNIQSASQKQINKPSDDPAGMARVLMARASISANSQYQRNLDQASGWLTTADSILSLGDSGVTSLLTQIKTLAEQAATDTYTADQRQMIAEEVRSYFLSLINYANTEYTGKSMFCGTDYTTTAFQLGTAADCYDADFLADLEDALSGSLTGTPEWITFSSNISSTALIRFTSGGTVGTDPISYEYTTDGGDTWVTGTMAPGDQEIDIDGVIMTIPAGVRVPTYDEDDPTNTQMWVRPTAVYQGSDPNMPAQIVRRGLDSAIEVSSTGTFSTDIQIRFDSDITDWSTSQEFTYSYSTDGGNTWVTQTGDTSDGRLLVPGGYISLTDTGATAIDAGTELTVKPQRTTLSIQGDSTYLTGVTNVGYEIFGGVYYSLDADGNTIQLTAQDGGAENVFETVGKLIGYLETNNVDGVSQCLADLATSLEHITVYAAQVGAQVNAVDTVKEKLITSKDAETEAMSAIEDVDLTELLTKLTQAQLAYQSVLKSTSMIMSMSLVDYI